MAGGILDLSWITVGSRRCVLAIVGFARTVMGSEARFSPGAVIICHIAVADHCCDSVGPVRMMSLANNVAHDRTCGFIPLTLGVRSHHICKNEGPSAAARNMIVCHERTEIAWKSSCRVGR